MFTFTSRPPSARKGERAKRRLKARPSSRNQKSSGVLCARQFAPEPAGLLFPTSSQRISATVKVFDVCLIFCLHLSIRGVHRNAEHSHEQNDDNRDDGLVFHPFFLPLEKYPDGFQIPPFYHNITIQSIHQIRSAFERIIRQIAASAGPHPARPHSDRRNAPSARSLTSGRTSQLAEASRPYSAHRFGHRSRAPARTAVRIRCPQRP